MPGASCPVAQKESQHWQSIANDLAEKTSHTMQGVDGGQGDCELCESM
jgi:hypothetical protein